MWCAWRRNYALGWFVIHGDAIDTAIAIIEEVDLVMVIINETGVSAVDCGERVRGLELEVLIDAGGSCVREEGREIGGGGVCASGAGGF